MIRSKHSSSNICPSEGLSIIPLQDNYFDIFYIENIEEIPPEPVDENVEPYVDEITGEVIEPEPIDPQPTYNWDEWRGYCRATNYNELLNAVVGLRYTPADKFDFSKSMTLAEYTVYNAYVNLCKKAVKKYFDAADAENPYTLSINVTDSMDMQSFNDITQMSLDDAKLYMISVTKNMLAVYLENNPLMSDIHEDGLKPYTCTADKQQQLMGMLMSYMLVTSAGGTMELTWNSTGETCVPWTYEQLTALSAQILAYVRPLAEKQRVFEKEIMKATSVDELKEMQFSYDD